MPYIRERGRQVVLVHGQRDSASGKVEQRILFVVYSRAEADEILGPGCGRFRGLLEDQYPELRFDWKKIERDLRSLLHALPPVHETREVDRKSEFRRDLLAFARQLLLADPQDSKTGEDLTRESRRELEFVRGVIDWHLKLIREEKPMSHPEDAFQWRFRVQGNEVPHSAEEHAMGLYERGEMEAAESAFRLLVDAFDGYADGYNMLGVMAVERGKGKEAIPLFEKTVEIGRRLFPKRVAKSDYWMRLETRPYIRGLRNLSGALISVGRYDEALALCDRLVKECGDDVTATSHRASICLNRRRWAEAADAALSIIGVDASENFIAAFALWELNRRHEALSSFLHAALNSPRAARIILDLRILPVKSAHEAEDHNAGIALARSIGGYLHGQRPSKRFFKRVMLDERVEHLLADGEAAVRRWSEAGGREAKPLFERMNEMKSVEFAEKQAGRLADLIGSEAP